MGNGIKGTGTSPKVYFGRFCKEYMSVVGIILLSIVFTICSPYFFTWDNWKNILLQTSTVAIVAMGQALCLLTGNFDLSLGRIVAPVSYTHLDVYKRQGYGSSPHDGLCEECDIYGQRNQK